MLFRILKPFLLCKVKLQVNFHNYGSIIDRLNLHCNGNKSNIPSLICENVKELWIQIGYFFPSTFLFVFDIVNYRIIMFSYLSLSIF